MKRQVLWIHLFQRKWHIFFFIFFYFFGRIKKDFRQTDIQDMATTEKASWWSITAYNEQAHILEAYRKGEKPLPSFVKKLYGGLEECPTTKRLHYQGALNTPQIRMSCLKKWIPGVHWEKARNIEGLKIYALKQETAIGEKSIQVNESYQTLGELIRELVIFRYDFMDKTEPSDINSKKEYLELIRYYIEQDETRGLSKASMLTDPRTSRAYAMIAKPIYRNYMVQLREMEMEEDDESVDS